MGTMFSTEQRITNDCCEVLGVHVLGGGGGGYGISDLRMDGWMGQLKPNIVPICKSMQNLHYF